MVNRHTLKICLTSFFVTSMLVEFIFGFPVDTKLIKYADIKHMPRNLLAEHVPILSSELVIHQYQYKPRGFSIETRKLSEKKIQVEFNFTSTQPYNKYVIRMRYHNHHMEYMTNKTLITPNEPNRILLKNFPPAQYVLCVTLFPSMYAANQQYYPISSSDMCVDIVFGPEHSFSHNKTGLLSPLLLVLAFLHLVAIALIQKLALAKKPAHSENVMKEKKKDYSLEVFNSLMNFNKEYNEAKNFAKLMSFYEECSDKQQDAFYFEDNSSLSNQLSSEKNFGDFDFSSQTKIIIQKHQNHKQRRRDSQDRQ